MRCAVLCVCAKGTSRQSGLQLRPLFDEWRRVPFVYDVPQCRAAEEVTEAIDIVALSLLSLGEVADQLCETTLRDDVAL